MKSKILYGLSLILNIFLVLSILTYFGYFEDLRIYFFSLSILFILILISYIIPLNYNIKTIKIGVDSEELYLLGSKQVNNKSKMYKVLAVLIPTLLLASIIYLNVLPFGYSKTYFININELGGIESNSNNLIYSLNFLQISWAAASLFLSYSSSVIFLLTEPFNWVKSNKSFFNLSSSYSFFGIFTIS